jgi:hypothetical protein
LNESGFYRDLGPLSRKLVLMSGSGKTHLKTITNSYMNSVITEFDLSKLTEGIYLQCIAGRIPLKKIMKNLPSTVGPDGDNSFGYDLTTSEEDSATEDDVIKQKREERKRKSMNRRHLLSES